MFGFLIRKNFYDLWDNLFRAAIINLGFIASLTIPVFGPALAGKLPFGSPLLGYGLFTAGVLWCCVYLAAGALSLKAVSDYGAFGFKDFFRQIKDAWPAGLAMGGIIIFLSALVFFVLPFYLGMNTMTGFLLGAVIFWTLVLSGVAFQFFFAVRARLGTNILKIIKKCFIIFFDNPGFCFAVLIHSLVFLALSVLLAFLFPGPAGILLLLDEALRLRLLKYDYLEANPGADRRHIPWDALLIEEREKTGTRTLKSFIFPWKD